MTKAKKQKTAEGVVFITDGSFRLPEAWKNIADTLRITGAGPIQIDAMRMAYYLGAAQVVTRIHESFEADDRAVWIEIHSDIDDVLKAFKTVGHA